MKVEISVMAVILCEDSVVTTHEEIYGEIKISLPKGHIEENETYLQTAIREVQEETGIILSESNFIKELRGFSYEFFNHNGEKISKKIVALLFKIDKKQDFVITETRIKKIEYLEINKFLEACSYDNVRAIMKQVI